MKNKPYPEYKNSGVEWLGDVPEHWGVKRLKDLLQTKKGAIKTGPFGSQLLSSEMYDGDIKVYNQKSVITNDFEYGENYISYDKFKELKEFQTFPGDFLITTRGTIGRCAILPQDAEQGILHPCLMRLQTNKTKVIDRFLEILIEESDVILEQLKIKSNGTTIEVIYQDSLKNVMILLPPLPEQQAIAAFLDRETSRIDTLIGKKEKLVELLKEKRTALISRAVTKGLNASVKLKPSGVEWLGEVPEHWGVKRLKYQSTINDETLPETKDPDYELLYVDISSIDPMQGIVQKEPMIFENAPSRARRIVKGGDTILSTVRTYLRAISPVKNPEPNLIVSTGFAVVRPNGVVPDYLSAVIRAPYFIEEVVSRSVGVSYPAINASEIGLIRIPLPPLPEQHAIAIFLDRETAKIDTLVSKVETAIEKLKEYRTALISAAVTGKIDVREAV